MLAPANLRQTIASGWALMRAGNSAGAIRQFRQALSSEPENIDALSGLCQSHLNLRQYHEASAQALDLLRIAPDRAVSHRLRAECLRNTKRRKEAVSAAQEAVRLEPREAVGYHILAVAFYDLKNYRAALKTVLEGRTIAPDDPVLIAQQALIVLQTRGGRAAEPLIDQALRLEMDSTYVLIIASRIAIMRNKLARARDLLAAVLQRDANNEGAISLYLLTDRRRYAILRSAAQFPNWRKEHGALGWIVWGVGILVLLLFFGLLAVATHVPGLAIGFGYRMFWQAQYKNHRKAVKAHFAEPVLRQGY